MRANVPLNEECIEAFDVLTANGVDAPLTDAPITAVFRTTEAADRMMGELRQLEKAGQTMFVTGLSGETCANKCPGASPAINAGRNINASSTRADSWWPGEAVAARGTTMRKLEVCSVFSSVSGVTMYRAAASR